MHWDRDGNGESDCEGIDGRNGNAACAENMTSGNMNAL